MAVEYSEFSRIRNKVRLLNENDAGDGISLDGGLTTTGNIKFSSGKGIDFSSSPTDSGIVTSQLLNDYEEGSWTPVFASDATQPTIAEYNSRLGSYIKIGNLVTICCHLQIKTLTSTGTGNIMIGGLPYGVDSSTNLGYSFSGLAAFYLDIGNLPAGAQAPYEFRVQTSSAVPTKLILRYSYDLAVPDSNLINWSIIGFS